MLYNNCYIQKNFIFQTTRTTWRVVGVNKVCVCDALKRRQGYNIITRLESLLRAASWVIRTWCVKVRTTQTVCVCVWLLLPSFLLLWERDSAVSYTRAWCMVCSKMRRRRKNTIISSIAPNFFYVTKRDILTPISANHQSNNEYIHI